MPDTTDAATGATPGAGATPAQASPAGTATGATPAAEAGKKPAAAAESATGEDALGESGKTVLRDARREAKEARDQAADLQRQLDELQSGTQSEHEKAVNQAKREAKAEERTVWTGRIRDAEVRGALRGAGIVNEKLLALAIQAPEFRELKVDDEGKVVGIPQAIEAFKKDSPELFATRAAPKEGAWDGAAGGASGGKKAANLEEAVNAEIQQQFARRGA